MRLPRHLGALPVSTRWSLFCFRCSCRSPYSRRVTLSEAPTPNKRQNYSKERRDSNRNSQGYSFVVEYRKHFRFLKIGWLSGRCIVGVMSTIRSGGIALPENWEPGQLIPFIHEFQSGGEDENHQTGFFGGLSH